MIELILFFSNFLVFRYWAYCYSHLRLYIT